MPKKLILKSFKGFKNSVILKFNVTKKKKDNWTKPVVRLFSKSTKTHVEIFQFLFTNFIIRSSYNLFSCLKNHRRMLHPKSSWFHDSHFEICDSNPSIVALINSIHFSSKIFGIRVQPLALSFRKICNKKLR